MTRPIAIPTTAPSTARCAAWALMALHTFAASPAVAATLTAEQLQRIEGDYTVPVYPQPFGFLVKGGVLHLKVGGVAASGDAAPLIEKEDGRFVASEDHPNAFQFRFEGGEVRFRFWAGNQSYDGARVGGSAPTSAALDPRAGGDPRSRQDVAAALTVAEATAAAPGATAADRLALARLLHESGEFARAREALASLVAGADASDAAIELAARLDFMTGRFAEAERGYDRLYALRAADSGRRTLSLAGKMFVLYQQDRFREIAALPFPKGARLPLLTAARDFTRDPYRIEWHGRRRETTVPFVAADPLPVFPINVDGTLINVILDTGADQLILDDRVARALGVKELDSATGSFAGGLTAKVGFGRVGSVRLGDVTLHGVPVQMLPAERFTFDLKHKVGGIAGTSLMRHFLGTVDYAKARLVLRERSPEGSAALRKALTRDRAVAVPFVLDATHLMFARGRIDGMDGMTLFVDSGLASEAALIAPEQTLRLLGIPLPETRLTASDVGGGAGAFAEGFFEVRSVALGALEQHGLRGEYGALTPDSYWARGFIQDALISHQFLRRHASWTLDFDARLFLVVR